MTFKLPICSECGSHNISWDAVAVWNPEVNQMELSATYDCATCQDCESEMKSGPDFVQFDLNPKKAMAELIEAMQGALDDLDGWAMAYPEGCTPEEKKRRNEFAVTLAVDQQAIKAMP